MGKAVSIIIPLYKGNKYLEKLLIMISALKVDKKRCEIIFVNDFPQEKIKLNQDEYEFSIKIVENLKNEGIHKSRVIGLTHATGEYIVFLDQDDYLSDKFFISQIPYLEKYEAVFSNGFWRNGEKIYSESNPVGYEYTLESYVNKGYPLVSLGQLLIRRECIPEGWKERCLSKNGCDDLLLWILMMIEKVNVSYNGECLYFHQENGTNASFNYSQMALSLEELASCIEQNKEINDVDKEKILGQVKEKKQKYVLYDRISSSIRKKKKEDVIQKLLGKGIERLAVFGVGIYGKWLIEILQDSSVDVLYAIDKRRDVKKATVPVIGIEEDGAKVDAIVITPVAELKSIRNDLKKKYDCEILSIEDLL